jgi:hypothetical protein
MKKLLKPKHQLAAYFYSGFILLEYSRICTDDIFSAALAIFLLQVIVHSDS